MEIKTILNDYRSNTPGAINTGILLWEMSVIPMLICNADTWNNISEATVKSLDNLQNLMLRYLFDTPRSTATPSLCWDSNMVTMKYRILEKQLNFAHHLSTLDDKSLGKEIFKTQMKYKFPGLVSHLKPIITRLGLPDIFDPNNKVTITKQSFKTKTKQAIHNECGKELKDRR